MWPSDLSAKLHRRDNFAKKFKTEEVNFADFAEKFANVEEKVSLNYKVGQ